MVDFSDIDAFIKHPRITALTASPDGSRVVAAIQVPDADGGRYLSALWEIDPTGAQAARRITFSAAGESAPQFASDGTLYFVSARPGSDGDDRTSAAIWALGAYGEAQVVADAPGGVSLVGIGGEAGVSRVLATTRVSAGARLEEDGQYRAARKERKPSAILHTGMPIRYWDDEVGADVTHLFAVSTQTDGTEPASSDPRNLTPRVEALNLLYQASDLSADGRTAAATWSTRTRRGETTSSVVVIDLTNPRENRAVLAKGTTTQSYSSPVIAPDGSRVALTRSTTSTPTDTSYSFVEIHPTAEHASTQDVVTVDLGKPGGLGDLTISGYLWAPDGATLYVYGDLHSAGAIVAVDAATGQVSSVIADDAVYTQPTVTEEGAAIVALRSTVAQPPTPVRIDLASTAASSETSVPVRELIAPGGVGTLPGKLERITTTVTHDDGGSVEVGAWLCTPRSASTKNPAPLMVWIHGGPHTSYNAWSWRWCPWLAVARGYAVLMPDPAMSTGYGQAGLNRGWPRRPGVVWAEVEALADLALRRRTLDSGRTALLGASFGGFMTNWIAGQTDRFAAIVTHAGLYALEQQHVTTDMAAWKTRQHRTAAEEPEWYAASSPDRRVGDITTPMLITHGNRDYRVPVSEALRLWWDLVSRHEGAERDFPHRFVQFTEQNHWVLTPEDARIWNQVVLDFCDHHVRGIGDPLSQVPFTP